MANDPVCGGEVNEQLTNARLTYEGKTYFFCSDQCRYDFQQDPRRYIGSTEPLDFSEQPDYSSPQG